MQVQVWTQSVVGKCAVGTPAALAAYRAAANKAAAWNSCNIR